MIEKGVVFECKDGVKTVACFSQEAFDELKKRYDMHNELVEAVENLVKALSDIGIKNAFLKNYTNLITEAKGE
jgi:hypothetical protein